MPKGSVLDNGYSWLDFLRRHNRWFTTVTAIYDLINRIRILDSQLAGHIIIVSVVGTIVNVRIKPSLAAAISFSEARSVLRIGLKPSALS